jgi:hypothetical protein
MYASIKSTMLGWWLFFIMLISVMINFVLSLLSAIFFTATFFLCGVNAENTSPAALREE